MNKFLEQSNINTSNLINYNPKDVDITSQNLSISKIISRLERHEIELNFGFNRQSRWSNQQQSLFIESILIRLPLPSFYFDGSHDENWLTIDGFQRITSLRNYIINKNFTLEGLEYLPQYEDYGFDDLPRDLQRRIYETTISVYIINPGTPDLVKYSIFKRINTGGVTLSSQEIRTALYYGIATNFINELAELSSFKQATTKSFSKSKMKDKEAITRYLSFILNDYKNYQSNFDKWLNLTMIKLKETSSEERNTIKSNFINAMNLAKDIFGKYAFRKQLDRRKKRQPINQSLFETWAVCLSNLEDIEQKQLSLKKEVAQTLFFEALKEDKEFIKSLRSNTNKSSKIKKRFKTIENIIQTAIK